MALDRNLLQTFDNLIKHISVYVENVKSDLILC